MSARLRFYYRGIDNDINHLSQFNILKFNSAWHYFQGFFFSFSYVFFILFFLIFLLFLFCPCSLSPFSSSLQFMFFVSSSHITCSSRFSSSSFSSDPSSSATFSSPFSAPSSPRPVSNPAFKRIPNRFLRDTSVNYPCSPTH